MKERLSFRGEIQKNKIYSYFLIFVVIVVLLGLTYVISMAVGGESGIMILFFGVIASLIYVLIGYFASDKIALVSVGAKLANGSKYRQYHDLVEGLCLASGIPKPKLYVMENSQINAFASGRNPKTSVICVTTGALEKLNKQELEGVLSHELSHVANYDIRFMTLTAVLVGMISIIAQIFLRSLWYNSGSNSNDKVKGVFLLIGIVLAIVAPILASLVQFAISRKREFGADSSAVKFTRTPSGLIGALKKIKSNSDMKVAGAVAPLFIAKPSKMAEWFSTHPPLEERIRRLEKM